jgi:hypothetical protein
MIRALAREVKLDKARSLGVETTDEAGLRKLAGG